MNQSKPCVLVTGGMGYIGSHTVVALFRQGYDVVIADNLCNSDVLILDRIEQISSQRPRFHQIDLCDKTSVKDLFELEPTIQAVIHFAALKAVGESVKMPLMYYQNNLGSLLNLLEIMQEVSVNNIVFSSSCTVYGEPDSLPVTETTPVKPATSPYGNTKQIGEEILADLSKVSEIHSIALRYFNPVGAHSSALIGEFPKGTPNNLVPFITQSAIGKLGPLQVYGNDYDTPDGTCIRDYIHVEDVAEAHVAAMHRLLSFEQQESFEVFNIGTGQGNTVLEAINAFEKSSGQKLHYTITSRRDGDIEKVYANTSKSNQILKWKAEKSLFEMMESAWAWELQLSKNSQND
jgi:UDP-glucose 4-epimerase